MSVNPNNACVDSHSMTTTETPEYNFQTADITVGMVLPWGETVVAVRRWATSQLCDDGEYNYSAWKVVCVREGINYHDYAVRSVWAGQSGYYHGSGEYFFTIHEALNEAGITEENK